MQSCLLRKSFSVDSRSFKDSGISLAHDISTIAYSTGFRSHSSCVSQPLNSEVSLTKLEGGQIFNCSGKEFRSEEYFGRNRRGWKETVESWQPSRGPLSPFIAPLTTKTQRYFIHFIHFDFFVAPQSLYFKVSVTKAARVFVLQISTNFIYSHRFREVSKKQNGNF